MIGEIYQDYSKWMVKKFKLMRLRNHLNKREASKYKNFNREMPKIIQTQTIASCNFNCSWCPANKHKDLYNNGMGKLMDEKLFKKIVRDIPKDFSGDFLPFLMNEPLLDKRLPELIRFARKNLPEAHIRINTNGSLLTRQNIIEFIDAGANRIAISDYTQKKTIKKRILGLELAEDYSKKLKFWWDKNPQYEKTGINIHNRAGNVPSFPIPETPLRLFCNKPFIELPIGWDGSVVLCCQDWKFKIIMGDAKKENILKIWKNSKYDEIRKNLMNFNRDMPLCRYCDFCGFGIK